MGIVFHANWIAYGESLETRRSYWKNLKKFSVIETESEWGWNDMK